MNYEKQAKCPELLERYFELVNLLPSDEILDKTIQTITEDYRLGWIEIGLKFDRQIYEYLLPAYIGHKAKELFIKLQNLIAMRELLGKIAERFRAEVIAPERIKQYQARTYGRILTEGEMMPYSLAEMRRLEGTIRFSHLLNTTVSASFLLSVDDEGCLHPDSELFDLFAQNKIFLNRIRLCQWCNQLFWAKRLGGNRDEGKLCSKKCRNNLWAKKDRLQKSIREMQNKLDKEKAKLDKLCSSLSPTNTLILDQETIVRKLEVKLNKKRENEKWQFINVQTVNFTG